jgi:protein TonB
VIKIKYLGILMAMLFTCNAVASDWTISKRIDPRYPIDAARAGLNGCVTLQFFINENGKTQYVEVLASSDPIFENSAYRALSQWEYENAGGSARAERRKIQLDFSSLYEKADASACYAELSPEPNDLQSFREQRLSTSIFAESAEQWALATRLYRSVLSDEESEVFTQKFEAIQAALLVEQSSVKSDGESTHLVKKAPEVLSKLYGLNYHQILTLNLGAAQVKPLKKPVQKLDESDIQKLPLLSMKEAITVWSLRDMHVGMDPETFKEISTQLLNVEIIIFEDGHAELLSTCREVSEQMQNMLASQFEDWQIRPVSKFAQPLRFIYSVPAPSDASSYLLCDADWHPQHSQEYFN